jgi:acetylornithine/succinyldiaminopimelate/putrescine aminotransferase
MPPEGYLRGLKELCEQRGILLILDEVQTGMGRTGTLFAHEAEGMTPHVMTVAKGLGGGLPMGALLATGDVAAALTPGTHATTFGGNPVTAAAGVAVLSVLVEDGLLERMRPTAARFRQGLQEIAAAYAPVVVEVRGRGWMLGMELREPCKELVQAAMARGLLINCTMDRVLRFVPPLVLSREEAEEALVRLRGAFQAVFG